MSCLHDYIGIKGCNSPAEASGLFINQLPGITLESMEKIAEKEQVNFMGVWKDVQDRAWFRLKKDFTRKIRSCFDIKDKNDVMNLLCDDVEDFQDVWLYLLGSELMLERTSSSRLNRFTTLDKDMAEQLRALYDSRYEAALDEAVKLIKIPEDDTSVESNPGISYQERLP